MLRTTDEALRMLQSADRYQRDVITISGNYAEVGKPSHSTNLTDAIQSGHIYSTTHSFGYS